MKHRLSPAALFVLGLPALPALIFPRAEAESVDDFEREGGGLAARTWSTN